MLCGNPVVLIGLVLVALTLHALAVGSHLSIVTEIVIYVLYAPASNVMLGYTGLVPFGASVFFGIATYVAAVGVQRFVGNEVEALVLSVRCVSLDRLGVRCPRAVASRPVFLAA
jgi:ABC-type branched-subunit amino acid transport system permease subunit